VILLPPQKKVCYTTRITSQRSMCQHDVVSQNLTRSPMSLLDPLCSSHLCACADAHTPPLLRNLQMHSKRSCSSSLLFPSVFHLVKFGNTRFTNVGIVKPSPYISRPNRRPSSQRPKENQVLKELGRRWWRLGLRLAMDQDKVIIDGRRPIDPLSTIYIVD
jgi:hypothetical protein